MPGTTRSRHHLRRRHRRRQTLPDPPRMTRYGLYCLWLLPALAHAQGHADDRIQCSSGRPDAAVIACTNIIRDARLEEFERATALKNRAFHYQEAGDLDQAITDYTAVLARPEQRRVQAKTYVNRGLMYSRKGATAAALADFTQAAQLDPKLDSAYINRASILMKEGNSDGAIADLNRAIQLDPRSAAVYLSRASVYAHRGDYARAAVDYTAAIKIDPTNPTTWLDRSLAYRALGNNERAGSAAAEAVRLTPTMRSARVE